MDANDGPLETALKEQQLLREALLLCDDTTADIVAVQMRFDRVDVRVAVNPDDDTITTAFGSSSVGVDEYFEPAREPWIEAVGMRVQWYWCMENNQGYCDGLQIEFVAAEGGGASHCIQMIAIASALSIRSVREIR